MGTTLFPYPGSKSQYVDEILQVLPQHNCYVEAFGGSSALLLNKPQSKVEIYNDANGDLVNFFLVFRDRTEELVEWLNRTPYSRELAEEYKEKTFDGEEWDSPLERAGAFFLLRFTQFGGITNDKGGFSTSHKKSHAKPYNNKIDQLEEFAQRFNEVVIENWDYNQLVNKYDSPTTCWYFDPPYVGAGDRLYSTDFDHDKFESVVSDLDGYAVISYSKVPKAFDSGYNLIEWDVNYSIRNGRENNNSERVERILTNFDPQTTSMVCDVQQLTVDAF